MGKKVILSAAILGLVFVGVILITQATGAQTSIINSADPKYQDGSYGLNDFIRLALRVSQIILGIVGTLTLMMFVYGGFTLLISAGSSEKIDKAKNIMVAAVIGLAIVFSSYLLIRAVMNSLGLNWDGSTKKPTVYTTSGTK